MKFARLKFASKRKRRLMVNEPLEQRREQEEARLEYERQRQSGPVSLLTVADMEFLRALRIDWAKEDER